MASSDLNSLMSMEKYGGSYLDQLSEQMAPFYTEPEKYLQCSSGMQKQIIDASKRVYDFMKDIEIYSSNPNSLNELLVTGFDNEQIWQQIQLQTGPCLSQLARNLNRLNLKNINLTGKSAMGGEKTKVKPDKVKEGKKSAKATLPEDLLEEEDESYDEDIDFAVDDEEEKIVPAKKYKKTVVDDAFFSLRQMEDCLNQQDKLEMMNNEDGVDDNDEDDDFDEDADFDENADDVDLFEEEEEDEGEVGNEDKADNEAVDNSMYTDFFDPPSVAEKKKQEPADKLDGVDLDDECMEEMEVVGDGDKDEMSSELEDELDGEIDQQAEDGEAGEDDDDEGEGEINEKDSSDKEDQDKIEQEDEEEEEEDEKVKSKFERKQKQMQDKIAKLEEANLSEKPWQLIGEASAKKRPMNSLLEEFMTFDHSSVGAPAVTEETTLSLEELIKQRVKDQAWDDVLRKDKPMLQPFEYKKSVEFNQEKSKLSLADVYEKEYLKQTDDNKEEKENEEHVNIRNLMDKLFVQLDALSNFHFTPKPPRPEIKVITNAPSLQVEEVLPITMTEASQLAPEEIYDKKKGELVGDEEKEDADRKRERRQKKIKKRFSEKAKEKQQKLKAQKSGKIAKSERKQAYDSLKKGVSNTMVDSRTTEKGVKSSNEFFSRLQQEVKENISKESSKGKKTSGKVKKSAEFLKL